MVQSAVSAGPRFTTFLVDLDGTLIDFDRAHHGVVEAYDADAPRYGAG